ncbi:hypothetical protein HIM_04542 [Hirsutella minnesotensis 3608]|uniref:USP domain-containing protein n=1 Tax=Hirsutella minnesotensis 3608 TaxID=1043627 RepID=A0A0F7ZL76_9HYPO|nr:hypothetical protein HIM_04542 [Hirsutella minnesotensis 3608]
MDYVPTSSTAPDHQEDAASPEPPASRPNPFDDTDISSRKRRRTSVSASPAASSFDIANPAHDASSTATLDLQRPPSASAMNIDDSLAPPRTPESRPLHTGSPLEPSSSKVTINLRKRSGSPSPSASVTTPLPPSDAVALVSDPANVDKIREAVRDNARGSSSRSPRSSSLSASPPIELISVADDDEQDEGDVNFTTATPEAEMTNSTMLLLDPTVQFPYTEPDESLCDTLQRLTQYLSTNTPIDATILGQVLEWLEEYLRYAKRVDPTAALASRCTHKSFWFAFPDIIFALTSRKPEFVKSPVLRNAIVALFTNFAVLTARFVFLDCLAVRELESLPPSPERRVPDLLAPIYLQQLHNLIGPLGVSRHIMVNGCPGISLVHQNLESYLSSKFQTSLGGSIDDLSQFSSALVSLVPQTPRLADSFAPVNQVLADCMRDSLRILRIGQDGAMQARQHLEQGHRAWNLLSAALMTAIEKHVTSLSAEHTSSSIQALAEILNMCLQGDHKHAMALLEDNQTTYPALPDRYHHEAIAWQWKVDVLEKLIRSSQMQLRVMAVTTMCNNLVTVWKRFCDGAEESSGEFLDHLASYLLQSGLISYILGPSCHPEIIVESANIVGFLVVTKTYRQEHTDHVWHGITSSQDPRVADALARMMGTIANLFDYAGLLHLCDRFQQLSLDKFSPSMRLLLDNVLGEMPGKAQTEQITLTFHPFGLCLRLLRESSVCASGSQVADPEMQQVAMQKFRDLLNYGPDAEGRRELYLSCIDDIAAKSPTTLGSMWCLSMAIRHATVGQIQVLTDQHDLARLIIEELEHACNLGRRQDAIPCLAGPSNQPRKDFITHLIQLQPAAISNDIGRKLWNILVGPQSTCIEDRKAGWHVILNVAKRAASPNIYLQMCFSKYLPDLSPVYFCEGLLEFVRERVHALLTDGSQEFMFDDEAAVARSGIEQLWRIILETQSEALVAQAIPILAVDVYLESGVIMSYPLHRARQVHLALVTRCLRQMQETARRLRRPSEGISSGEDDLMVVITTAEDVERNQLIFTRSLKLMRFFLEKYQTKPMFAVADLRSFMSDVPHQIEGDSARLKYQSFDGDEQTDILPLNIGKLNTVSSLLASLRRETGFDNYRVYYRGRQLLPTEQDICKSLQELDIQDGFILVRREETTSTSPVRIKPGSLPLEIEIMTHFPQLWEYLSMDDGIAEEIYDFVVKLPADGFIISRFESDATSYRDLFLPGQPFKSLYALHALTEYVESVSRESSNIEPGLRQDEPSSSRAEALARSLHLVVQALSDHEVIEGITLRLRVRLASSLLQKFIRLIQAVFEADPRSSSDSINVPTPSRLVQILSDAVSLEDGDVLPLIVSTCNAILLVSRMNPPFWKSIMQSSDFQALIEQLVLFEPRRDVRTAIVGLIEFAVQVQTQTSQKQVIDLTGPEPEETANLAEYLWPIVAGLLTPATELPAQCEEFFRLLKCLLLRLASKLAGLPLFERLAAETSQRLLNHEVTEDVSHTQPYDPIVNGLAAVLYLCLQIDTSLVESNIVPDKMAQTLLWQHLFPRKRTSGVADAVPRVVLNPESRAKLYEVIHRLISHDAGQLGQTLDMLNSLVPFYSQDTDDPYLYDLPFQFDRSKAMRSSCGYVGLRNLSNTCYLNSLLTQLYMNTEFRRFILGASCRGPSSSQQLLFHTQKVFGFMQESYRRYIDPTTLVGAIKTYEDTVIDIHSQMDVDEFYSLLFDRWEGQLPDHEDKLKLRSFYGGQLVQQVKSKECEHISERLEPFSAIQCDIKGKSTLEESLQAYVDGEIMEGDNKYKCSTCDRHVDAVKRACLKDVPDNVIFHLKRFDFNLRTLQRSKINDHFSFPPTIDLRPYTIEHLSQEGADVPQDIFELVGVLVHSGTAESGHYYSYIKERPCEPGMNKWIEFNDDVVTPWDPSLMASSTFGGPDSRSVYETNGIIYDKSYSAYMLFYQRVSSLQSEQENMALRLQDAPLRVDMPLPLKEHIIHENTVLLRRHCLFDPAHAIFVQNCFSRARGHDRAQNSYAMPSNGKEGTHDGQHANHDLQNLAMETVLSHLDQVVARTKDTPFFGTFSTMIRAGVASCDHCALALYDYFDMRPMAFRALLQRNPEQHVRAFAGEILVRAAEKISHGLSHLYWRSSLTRSRPGSSSSEEAMEAEDQGVGTTERSVMEGVITLLNHLWQFFHMNLRSWDEYFGTILSFAKLGHREISFVLSEDYLLKLLRIVTADTCVDLPPNYARMLNNVLRRINTRPPSYSAIISLIDYLLGQLEAGLGPEAIVDRPRERLGLQSPFPWTSEEVHAVHHYPDATEASFFVEKLVSIDQAWSVTNDIVARLISVGGEMDRLVLNTLRKCIQGELSTQPMDPFLRVAARYAESTKSADNARLLVRHIGIQARSLQNTEGAAFINFFKVAMRSDRPNAELARLRREIARDTVPLWAPHLLVYSDANARRDAEQLIEDQIFEHSSVKAGGEGESEVESREHFDRVVRDMGLKCLLYLQEIHVKRKVKIERDAAWSILRVVGRCAASFERSQNDGDEDLDVEFAAIQSEVMEPLRRLMVDEVEDDGSDWDESCVSSDPMEVNVGAPTQTMNEANDTDLV